jgi:hypothetical protein
MMNQNGLEGITLPGKAEMSAVIVRIAEIVVVRVMVKVIVVAIMGKADEIAEGKVIMGKAGEDIMIIFPMMEKVGKVVIGIEEGMDFASRMLMVLLEALILWEANL